jgi:hypothetical protein
MISTGKNLQEDHDSLGPTDENRQMFGFAQVRAKGKTRAGLCVSKLDERNRITFETRIVRQRGGRRRPSQGGNASDPPFWKSVNITADTEIQESDKRGTLTEREKPGTSGNGTGNSEKKMVLVREKNG